MDKILYHEIEFISSALSPVSRAVPDFNKTLLQSCLLLMPFRREGPSLLFSCVCLTSPIDNPIYNPRE